MKNGFVKINPDKTSGFWNAKEGATLQGVLLGRYYGEKSESFYYQFRLTVPTVCVDSDRKNVTVDIGSVVSVNTYTALDSSLKQLAENEPGEWEILIECLGKVKAKKGHAFLFNIGKKPVEDSNDDDNDADNNAKNDTHDNSEVEEDDLPY